MEVIPRAVVVEGSLTEEMALGLSANLRVGQERMKDPTS